MKGFFSLMLFTVFMFITGYSLYGQKTEIIYLSGTGSDNTAEWKFFCTSGRNSGKWTTIPVPSNWEQFGFGKYDYGHAKDTVRGKETGLYQYTFNVPAAWKGNSISIVFEGSMTDTEVKINGKSTGPVHQGGFYRFQYDISGLLEYGKPNLLDVKVSKHSSNLSVNKAERIGDFWIFGGIFRPVYLEVKPFQNIERLAINAQADGSFKSEVYLKNIRNAGEVIGQIRTSDGKNVGNSFTSLVKRNTNTKVVLSTSVESPLLWSSEFPNLYEVELTWVENGKAVHSVTEKFGFRTVELRERDGIYVNGQKIKFKGVNRHSFRSETGRALSKKQCIEDALLIKEMNMNSVRNSHYPPDEYFLDACDSLGLFVMDELAGWHGNYDTKTGTKLIGEMMESNQNHPSIIIWANGNEGGHNFELDAVFDSLDFQQRPVCHPWENFRGMNTEHYINYDYGNGVHFHGHDVVFPTEFLHGLYDGGHGAGLYDYWEYMWKLPLSAGGFLWDFADAGIIRTDKNGEIDTDGNHGADGILGPHLEKEASFYTIKEVWSPVYFEQREITNKFDGVFSIGNRFHFTNTTQCSFSYTFTKVAAPGQTEVKSVKGNIKSPDIKPGDKGLLAIDLPSDWNDYDILSIKAADPHGNELYTWSWPIKLPEEVSKNLVKKDGQKPNVITKQDSLVVVSAGKAEFTFNRNNGLLQDVKNEKGKISFQNGPVLCEGVSDFKEIITSFEGETLILNYKFGEKSNYRDMKWMIYPSGWIALEFSYRPTNYEFDMLGVSFTYPEELVKGVEWFGNGPYRVWKNRMQGNELSFWRKEYNNTITGKSGYEYPEFKGYHSNLYWVKINSKEQDFVIATANEDIFLRLFTPAFPNDPFNTAPVFPSGDISFMHAIPAIGTKSQEAVNMGPSGKKNMYFDYWKQRAKTMTLYFDFTGNYQR